MPHKIILLSKMELGYSLVEFHNWKNWRNKNCLEVVDTTGEQQWKKILWSENRYRLENFKLGVYVLWFPTWHREYPCKLKRCWFGLYCVQYYFHNNIILLVNLDRFDHNLVLVNANKLKPYVPMTIIP